MEELKFPKLKFEDRKLDTMLNMNHVNDCLIEFSRVEIIDKENVKKKFTRHN